MTLFFLLPILALTTLDGMAKIFVSHCILRPIVTYFFKPWLLSYLLPCYGQDSNPRPLSPQLCILSARLRRPAQNKTYTTPIGLANTILRTGYHLELPRISSVVFFILMCIVSGLALAIVLLFAGLGLSDAIYVHIDCNYDLGGCCSYRMQSNWEARGTYVSRHA